MTLNNKELLKFNSRVKALGKELKHNTDAETWRYLGVPASTGRHWKAGRSSPTRERVKAIEDALLKRQEQCNDESCAIFNFITA